MANTYTNRLKKRLPAAGDIGWDDEWHDNERIDEVVLGALLSANRVISGGEVTAGSGLTASFAALVGLVAGVTYSVAAGSVNLTGASSGAEQTNWVSLTSAGNVVASTAPPAGDYVPLALVDTSDTAVIRIADLRPFAPGGSAPCGAIMPWIGGYFTNNANAGFTSVLGNSVAAVNALLNASGWHVCDGTALNLSGSLIFNGPARFLPNLTDNRFVMGGTAAGNIGGNNDMSHTHSVPTHTHATQDFTLGTAHIPSHSHLVGIINDGWVANGSGLWTSAVDHYPGSSTRVTSSYGSSGAHNHGATGASAASNTGASSNTENRPAFLSCLYIMRVK